MSDSAFEATGTSLPFQALPASEARAESASKDHVIDAMRGFAALLVAYTTHLIRATQRFKAVVIGGTLAIGLLYLVTIVLQLFHVATPFMYDSSALSIGISLAIVGFAALNLILDFDLIETGVAQGAPRYMEWYGAFGLLVTLVWLYLEILRLLSKLNDRR